MVGWSTTTYNCFAVPTWCCSRSNHPRGAWLADKEATAITHHPLRNHSHAASAPRVGVAAMADTAASPTADVARQQQFCELTGASRDQAAFMLEATHGNLEQAVQMYLGEQK